MKIKKNGKVITLSESDLKRIVGVVLREDTKGDPGTDLVQCCKEAKIDTTKLPSCVSGDVTKCMTELGEMITNDPLGMGMKALVALNCLKDKVTSPVMNESRIVRRRIKESMGAERFSLDDVESGLCGRRGSWELKGKTLVLVNCTFDDGVEEPFKVDAHIASCNDEQGLEKRGKYGIESIHKIQKY